MAKTIDRKQSRRQRRIERAKRAWLKARERHIDAEIALRKAHDRYVDAASWEYL